MRPEKIHRGTPDLYTPSPTVVPHTPCTDDHSVEEPRFIIPLSGARASSSANCHGENTPALICRLTHHQLLGKLCGYAAVRLVHTSCSSLASKVEFPVSDRGNIAVNFHLFLDETARDQIDTRRCTEIVMNRYYMQRLRESLDEWK